MKLQRYGVVDDGFMPREIVLLQALRCSWGKCTFCDYHEDNTVSVAVAHNLNKQVLSSVTGKHGVLEVIDSASWTELPLGTMLEILRVCELHKIHTVIFEGHWMYKEQIPEYRALFNKAGITTKYILGAESFNSIRRQILRKGMPISLEPFQMANHFDAVNLLFGDNASGTPAMFFYNEVKKASREFEFVNVNIFTDNAVARLNGLYRSVAAVEEFYTLGIADKCVELGNVFVFDFGDSRSPHNLGGVGSSI